MTKNLQKVPPLKSNENNRLHGENMVLVPPSFAPESLPLFSSAAEKEVDGIGMGVLETGVPFLTQAGLAKFCGVNQSAIRVLTSNWKEEKEKPRGRYINKILQDNNYFEDDLFIVVQSSKGQKYYAFPDVICLAFLDYYAFEAKNEIALKRIRILAKKTFRIFVYESCGYSPQEGQQESWKYFYDRVSLVKNSVPEGYFSIFNEGAGMTADLISAGFIVNEKTIPDISIGSCWAQHWKSNNLYEKYGNIMRYEHNYPESYSQSLSNPQKASAYPLEAIKEFRSWFKNTYLPQCFPKYILKKNHLVLSGRANAEKMISILNNKLAS